MKNVMDNFHCLQKQSQTERVCVCVCWVGRGSGEKVTEA